MTLQKTSTAKRKRNNTRIQLPNGASCTEPSVNPANWNTARASLKEHWYVKLNFYAADGTKKSVTRKNMNDYATLAERQQATRIVIEVLKEDLLAGWNPIEEKKFTPLAPAHAEPAAPPVPVGTGPHSPLPRALAFAVIKRYKYRKRFIPENGAKADKVLVEVRSYVRHFIATAKRLKLGDKLIADVRRRDVLEILETLSKERNWGYASWNNCIAYLAALWETLFTYDVTENNPVKGIAKQTPTPEPPLLLTEEEREIIRVHLAKVKPPFGRAVSIFFASGGREAELSRVQGKHVNLSQQEFKAWVLKGKAGWRLVTKAITDAVLQDWTEAMEGCVPEDYVFSDRFKPGPNCNGREKWNRWWNRYVNKQLGIPGRLYPLKHLHTTETANESEPMAADFNSHTSERMNRERYDLLSEKRKLEARKRQNLKF